MLLSYSTALEPKRPFRNRLDDYSFQKIGKSPIENPRQKTAAELRRIHDYYIELHQKRDTYKSPIISDLRSLTWFRGHADEKSHPKAFRFLNDESQKEAQNISAEINRSFTVYDGKERSMQVSTLDHFMYFKTLNQEPESRELLREEFLAQYTKEKMALASPNLDSFVSRYNLLVRETPRLTKNESLTKAEILKATEDISSYNQLFCKIENTIKVSPLDSLPDFARAYMTLSMAMKYSNAVKNSFSPDLEISDQALDHLLSMNRIYFDPELQHTFHSLNNLAEAKLEQSFLLDFGKPSESLKQKQKWAKRISKGIKAELRQKGWLSVLKNPNSSLRVILDDYKGLLKAASIISSEGKTPLIAQLLRWRGNPLSLLVSSEKTKSNKAALKQILRNLYEASYKTDRVDTADTTKLMLLFSYLGQQESFMSQESVLLDEIEVALGHGKANNLPFQPSFIQKPFWT